MRWGLRRGVSCELGEVGQFWRWLAALPSATYSEGEALKNLESRLGSGLILSLKGLSEDVDDSGDERLESSLFKEKRSVMFILEIRQLDAAHNLGSLVLLDELGELSERPHGPHTNAETLGVGESLAEELDELGDVVGDGSPGLGGGNNEGIEEHEDGLEGDLTVSGVGRGREVPQPRKELGPGAVLELDASENRGKTSSGGAGLSTLTRKVGNDARRNLSGSANCARAEASSRKLGDIRGLGEDDLKDASLHGSAKLASLGEPLLVLLGLNTLAKLDESQLTDLRAASKIALALLLTSPSSCTRVMPSHPVSLPQTLFSPQKVNTFWCLAPAPHWTRCRGRESSSSLCNTLQSPRDPRPSNLRQSRGSKYQSRKERARIASRCRSGC